MDVLPFHPYLPRSERTSEVVHSFFLQKVPLVETLPWIGGVHVPKRTLREFISKMRRERVNRVPSLHWIVEEPMEKRWGSDNEQIWIFICPYVLERVERQELQRRQKWEGPVSQTTVNQVSVKVESLRSPRWTFQGVSDRSSEEINEVLFTKEKDVVQVSRGSMGLETLEREVFR